MTFGKVAVEMTLDLSPKLGEMRVEPGEALAGKLLAVEEAGKFQIARACGLGIVVVEAEQLEMDDRRDALQHGRQFGLIVGDDDEIRLQFGDALDIRLVALADIFHVRPESRLNDPEAVAFRVGDGEERNVELDELFDDRPGQRDHALRNLVEGLGAPAVGDRRLPKGGRCHGKKGRKNGAAGYRIHLRPRSRSGGHRRDGREAGCRCRRVRSGDGPT